MLALSFLVSSVCLASFCIGADHVIFSREDHWKRLPEGKALRAVCDSLVHGVVGGWCWVNVVLVNQVEWNWARLIQVVFCVAMAAGMDLDHMIEARSLHIEDALTLNHRPFAHNTSLVPIIAVMLCAILYFFPVLKQNSLTRDIPLMFTVSILSHHLRDADRRGVWLAPFGSTPPIMHKLYVLLVTLIPVCMVAVPVMVKQLLISLTNHPTKIFDV